MVAMLLSPAFPGVLVALAAAAVRALECTPPPSRWAVPLVAVWAAPVAVMTLRTGSGLGCALTSCRLW
jgi:hypothetical protein